MAHSGEICFEFPHWYVFGFSNPITQSSNSQWILTECPAIYLSSDTICLEMNSYRLKAQPHNTATPPQLQAPLASPDCPACFWPTGNRSEAPTTPSSGLINLLASLREMLYLLGYRLIIKGYHSGASRGRSFHALSPIALLPNLHVLTKSKPCPLGFYGNLIMLPWWWNLWPLATEPFSALLSPSCLPRARDLAGAAGDPWQPAPHLWFLGAFQMLPH